MEFRTDGPLDAGGVDNREPFEKLGRIRHRLYRIRHQNAGHAVRELHFQ